MMKKMFSFFLSGYKSYPMEIQKKSRIVLIILLGSYVIGISILTIEIVLKLAFGAYLPFIFGLFFGLIILVFLKSGKYNAASTLLIFMFIITSTSIIFADPQDNQFEFYRYAFSMLFALLVSCLISYRINQVIIVIAAGDIGLILLYFLKFASVHDYPLARITVINCLLLYNLCGLFGWLVLYITKQIVRIAEDNAEATLLEKNESERRLKILEVYTKPSIVRTVESGGDPRNDEPVRHNESVLFCDIRNFTSISETMNPIDLVKLLNIYFNEMNDVIIKNGGEIDKLIGDNIMAIFNKSDDAIVSSIIMRNTLKRLKTIAGFPPDLNNGIGINYGLVVKGNIGSLMKKDNTVIGDVVNAASRLEALNKTYNTDIIISDELKQNLENNYRILPLDIVFVKGKKQPEKIYEVYDHKTDEEIEWKNNIKKDFTDAFNYYEDGNFMKALAIYKGIIDRTKTDYGFLGFFINRCEILNKRKIEGGLKDWNGIYSF